MFISDDLFLGAFWDRTGQALWILQTEGLMMRVADRNAGVVREDP